LRGMTEKRSIIAYKSMSVVKHFIVRFSVKI
jgi:hypothetical protein